MKFIINKGQPFEAIVSVKKNGSPTPAVIVSVGNFIISGIEPNSIDERCIYITSQLTVEDAQNGKVKISLTSDETSLLPVLEGCREDGSRGLQTCKGVMDITTEDAGRFFANIPEIYVEGTGEQCTT